MDPQACFVRIINALTDFDREDGIAACDDMIEWLGKGGFHPAVKSNSSQHSLVQPIPTSFFCNLRFLLRKGRT